MGDGGLVMEVVVGVGCWGNRQQKEGYKEKDRLLDRKSPTPADLSELQVD